MKRGSSLALIFLAWNFFCMILPGEVVEEEVWYGADGKVVKKVTRTYTGADRPSNVSTWEPSWVAREREQAKRLAEGRRGSARGRYSTSSRYYGSGLYYWYPRTTRYYSWRNPRSYVPYRSGWHVRAGSGRLIINYSR